MLQQTVLKGETTVAGTQNYQGGRLDDDNNRPIGVFTIISDSFAGVTDLGNLNTAMVRFQLFFDAGHHGQHGHGGGGGGRPQIQETVVLEGACEFNTPPPGLPNTPGQPTAGRQITRAAGSVAAATPAFAALLDHQWHLNGTTLTIV
jgi:hypothetical protein